MRRCAALRLSLGLTQNALAQVTGLHPSLVSQIESGYIGRPYPKQLAALSVGLRFEGDPAELLETVPPLEQAARVLLDESGEGR
jgi:transcriptional regulator with XRE-family HTH domain